MKKMLTIVASALLIGTSVAAVHSALAGAPEAPQPKANTVKQQRLPIQEENAFYKNITFDLTGVTEEQAGQSEYWDERRQEYVPYLNYTGNRIDEDRYHQYVTIHYGMWSAEGPMVDGDKVNDFTIDTFIDDIDVLNATIHCSKMVGIDADHPIHLNYELPITYGDDWFTVDITNPGDKNMDNINIHLTVGQSMVIDHVDFQVGILGTHTQGYKMADLGDGNYLGYIISDVSGCPGITNGRYALITQIATEGTEFDIPETITDEGVDYQVIAVGVYEYYQSWNDWYGTNSLFAVAAPGCKTLRIPESAKVVKLYQTNFEDIYVYGSPKLVFEIRYAEDNGPIRQNVHVDNQAAHKYYLLNKDWNCTKDYPVDWVEVNVTEPGTWAETYIDLVGEDWSGIEWMRVTGPINSVDMAHMNYLDYIEKIDLSDTEVTTIPSHFLSSSKRTLSEVILPTTTRTIENSAFDGYNSLKSINLENVTDIGNSAFYATSIGDPDLGCAVNIGRHAFNNCKNINTIRFRNIKRIEGGAFQDCASLESVIFNT